MKFLIGVYLVYCQFKSPTSVVLCTIRKVTFSGIVNVIKVAGIRPGGSYTEQERENICEGVKIMKVDLLAGKDIIIRTTGTAAQVSAETVSNNNHHWHY